jgi:hypothetical protein
MAKMLTYVGPFGGKIVILNVISSLIKNLFMMKNKYKVKNF